MHISGVPAQHKALNGGGSIPGIGRVFEGVHGEDTLAERMAWEQQCDRHMRQFSEV